MNKITIKFSSGGLSNKGFNEQLTIRERFIEYSIGWWRFDKKHSREDEIDGRDFSYRIKTSIPKKEMDLFCQRICEIKERESIILDMSILSIQLDMNGEEINKVLYVPILDVVPEFLYRFINEYLPKDFMFPRFLRMYHRSTFEDMEMVINHCVEFLSDVRSDYKDKTDDFSSGVNLGLYMAYDTLRENLPCYIFKEDILKNCGLEEDSEVLFGHINKKIRIVK